MTAAAIPSSLAHLGLPPVSHLGIVVNDMEKALAQYGPLFGPFHRVKFENHDFDYRGGLADCSLDVALGYSGDLEIEITQPLTGKCPHFEFLGRGGEGLHHMQFRFDAVDPWIARLQAAGWEKIWGKRSKDFTFFYMEKPDSPVLLEIIEPLPRSRHGAHVVT